MIKKYCTQIEYVFRSLISTYSKPEHIANAHKYHGSQIDQERYNQETQ